MQDSIRNDYMLIQIEPSFTDERLASEQIDRLIISTRFKPYSLYPITQWPCHVYVARVADPSVFQALRFIKEQVHLIAWGALFQKFEQARSFAADEDA
jgi:hypothetical protein